MLRVDALCASELSVRKPLQNLLLLAIVALLGGCVSSRHVAPGKYLLDKVSLKIEDNDGTLSEQEMLTYLRQHPNQKMLWSVKVRLGVYNLSGNDSTRWWNRFVRKLGEPPVEFDSALTDASIRQLERALENKGFLSPKVTATIDTNEIKRKVKVNYRLEPGESHRIRNINYEFANDTLRELIMRDSAHFTVRPGDPLNREILESQREVITSNLRNRGYYAFAKEFVTFNADTTEGSKDVDLTMKVNPPYPRQEGRISLATHREYVVRNIMFITDYDPTDPRPLSTWEAADTVDYKGYTILYGDKKYLRPSVLADNCFILPGKPYNQRRVDRTYQALSRLDILRFINIKFMPVGDVNDTGILDAYILLTRGKSQTMSVELEGTNSEGDLGVAASVGYSHRNLGRGSETLNARLRGAYESLSGNLDGLIHNRYMEYSLDLGVVFPKFKAPFLRESFKRKINARTEFHVSLNYQERPEYTRIISTLGWSYKWTERITRNRHTYMPIDINYVYLPESTNDFLDLIAPDNPLLRYSYEDHFIMRMGYSFYHTNKRPERPWDRGFQPSLYTIRVNAETAGNLLFALSSIFDHRSNFHQDPYKIFGIRYSQYVKVDADFAWHHTFDRRNSVALYAGFGIGIPYGNSSILPFEKRFYGGGANGVRGWDVRTLGPGSFPGTNSVSDFINQCGDIRLDLSAEYRAKLFWVLELGAFIDAGNIWTIHNYSNQPGGMFHFNTFYKQLAASYGLGLRLDFSYFLLRLDMGMKAHNPAMNAEKWPLIHPKWGRDHSFHFSIGYPF